MSGQENKKLRRSFFKRKGFWIFCLICLILLVAVGVIGNIMLEPYREIANDYDLERVGEKEEMSFIHDRSGHEIGTMFVENRFSIPLNDIPPVFVNAVLAQEDQRFYEHNGVDWTGVARAAYLNVKSGSVTQGAGTITMQLARKSFDLLGEAKRREWSGYERKIVEAYVALGIEEHLFEQMRLDFPGDQSGGKKAVKARILEMYLNLVPFGSGYYGVRSAALGYFGKEPKDLSIPECASIVACLKNPTRISPLRNLDENKTNRDHVLRRMALEEMITPEERDEMIAQPVVINPIPIRRGKSYLYELVAKQARDLVGEEALSRGGYTIRTTINARVQRTAEDALARHLDEVENTLGYSHAKHADYERSQGKLKYLQGAVLMIDHETGEVIAHVGGRDYADSQYDFIVSGRRPLGTGFFPFVYASAFENGRHPATLVVDEQMEVRKLQVGGDLEGVVGEWGMEVSDPEYEGKITSRRALGVSKIAATVELGQEVGLRNVVKTGEGFGFDLPTQKILNRTLVGFDQVNMNEVVSAYSAFPRGGSRIAEKRYIREIRDIDGKIVYPLSGKRIEPVTREACSEATAFQVHSILNEVMRTGNLKDVSRDLSPSLLLGGGKSGTPYGFSDAWMAGYNSQITCAVWVGFYDGGRKAIHESAFAKDVAFPIWQEVMNASQPTFAGREILPPDSVEKVAVCRISGMRPTRYCHESVENPETRELSYRSTSYPEFLRKGEEMGICSIHGGGIDIQSFVENRPSPRTINAIPIKAKAPLLLGFDPYHSETPTLGVEDDEATAWQYANAIIVEDRVSGEREALLKLPRPPRFELPRPSQAAEKTAKSE